MSQLIKITIKKLPASSFGASTEAALNAEVEAVLFIIWFFGPQMSIKLSKSKKYQIR